MRRAGPAGPPHTAAPLFHAQQHHAVRRHFIPELVLLVTAVVVPPKAPHAMLAAQPEILPAHGHLGGLRPAVEQPDGPLAAGQRLGPHLVGALLCDTVSLLAKRV